MLWEVGGAKTASLFKKFMSNLENEIVTSDNGRKACSSLQLSPTMLQKKKKGRIGSSWTERESSRVLNVALGREYRH